MAQPKRWHVGSQVEVARCALAQGNDAVCRASGGVCSYQGKWRGVLKLGKAMAVCGGVWRRVLSLGDVERACDCLDPPFGLSLGGWNACIDFKLTAATQVVPCPPRLACERPPGNRGICATKGMACGADFDRVCTRLHSFALVRTRLCRGCGCHARRCLYAPASRSC